MDRKEVIKNLRSKKYTYLEIGKVLGVSKQRIHQIYKNYDTVNKSSIKEFKANHPNCDICNSQHNLEAHHINGDRKNSSFKNLRVLCRKCHRELESNFYKKYKKATERNRGSFNKCVQCEKSIWVEPCRKKRLWGRFCSKKCFGLSIRKTEEEKRLRRNKYQLNYYKTHPEYRAYLIKFGKERYRKIKGLLTQV